MTNQIGRKFTLEFKAKVVLHVAKDLLTLVQMLQKLDDKKWTFFLDDE